MSLNKDIKFSDYVKLTEMKNLILVHLNKMGMKEQVRTMNDDDLEKIMYMMSLMGDQLKLKENDTERIELLISYTVCLWTRLIVDYGVDLKEL